MNCTMFDEFTEPSAWARSANLNLWRKWDGLVVVIFSYRRRKEYGYLVIDGDDKRFGGPCISEDEAKYEAFLSIEEGDQCR